MTTAATGLGLDLGAALDLEKVRLDFPILERRVHGRPLAYLDNAASAQRPTAVLEAMDRCYQHYYSNVHRGVHTLAQESTDAYEAARERVRSFLGAASSSEVVFVRGTTEAINLVAQSYGRQQLKAGDEVLLSLMEHHSNIVPWQLLCQQSGASLRVIPVTDEGELDLDAFERLLCERTRIVALTHVSNALGTINPVRKIVQRAHEAGAAVVLDGAQAAPHLRIDVRELDCDFYAFSGHKAFAPNGIGVLYGKYDLLASMPPWQGGGEMIRSVSFEHTEFQDPPYRFEAGTPYLVGAIGSAAAIDYLEELGLEKIAAHERRLLTCATERLEQLAAVRIQGTAPDKVSLVSFTVNGIHAHDIGTILDQQGIAVRAGHHCAQPLMERFGVPATSRASFAFYNTFDEIDRLVSGIEEACGCLAEVLGSAMSDLRSLYQEVILDHYKHPRNFGALEGADRHAEGYNPLCGDQIKLHLRLDAEQDRVEDIAFEGSGCAISTASASLMTEAVKGLERGQVVDLMHRFHGLLTGDLDADSSAFELGKLEVLAGVREYPVRIKCATLAWHALMAALEDEPASAVSTE